MDTPGDYRREGDTHHLVISWDDLREAWRAAMRNDLPVKRAGNVRKLQQYIGMWRAGGKWLGFNAVDVERWLSEGYQPPAMPMDAEALPTRKRRKLRFAEEGEYHHDLALSGYDYPFQSWERRAHKAGLLIDARISLSAATGGKTVAQYLTWLCSIVRSLEMEGVDCAVQITTDTVRSLRQSPADKAQLSVLVKRENEAQDETSWSPMLSPAGFRGFMFLMIHMLCEHARADICNDLGSPGQSVNEWKVDWEPDSRRLTLHSPKSASNFPEAEMTEQVMAAVRSH
jgi:hypothetical protein